jgi:hypothetical protein
MIIEDFLFSILALAALRRLPKAIAAIMQFARATLKR